MLEPNTNNNLMRNGTKQLFTEARKKTHLDKEIVEDFLTAEIQRLITKAHKKGLSERAKSDWNKRRNKEQAKKVVAEVKVEGEQK